MRRREVTAALAAGLLSSACSTVPGAGRAGAPAPANGAVARLTAAADANPLLAAWAGAHGAPPPWDHAQAGAFPAALELGVALRQTEIEAIVANPAAPTFDNTIGALQNAGRHLGRARLMFFGVLTENISNPEIQAIERDWSPRLDAADDAIAFNRALFARIDALYQARAGHNLTAEQLRLLTRTRDAYVRAGAALAPAAQTRLGEINQRLSVLFTDFGAKLLADENTAIFIEREADLAGLPPSLRSAYAAAAAERGRAGQWAVVNTRSSVDPFLTFSERRDLRERVWTAFKNRGDNEGANNTNAIIAELVRLRAERAHLLGFSTHAHYRMADTMAIDPARAQDLMMRVWRPAVARVRQEVADMQAIADRQHANITIAPWDYLFYAEQVRRDRYSLDQNELRAYFEINNMIRAAFFMAEQLYGITFTEITGQVPAFHADVRVWEVRNAADNSYRGLFYGDYFARAGKRSGAWAQGYRGHETFTGARVTAITSNNNNFVRGAAGEPVLISLDDAETLFHEFGHALHGLLSEVNYPGLAGTPRDFVEYPSQVHEHWVLTRPILDRFARHYQTGAAMPEALVERVRNAATFNQGYATVEYLSSAIVDMELHLVPDGVIDADRFERETLARIGMPREMAMRHRLPQFGHLFSSDSYSAGYYSYLWSETMDADTWEMFEASGNVFDPAVAAGMRRYILAPGNSTDRTEAYRAFRGRDPDVAALLRQRGFPTT